MGNQASKVIAQKKKQEKNEKPEPSSRRSSITEFFSKRKQSITSLMKKEQDMKEHDLQQREHYLLKLARKGNTWTNLDSPKVIVESGIGNGIWALEMATQYSESQVIGLDLKLPGIQLANQTFHRANILETWPIDDDSADFVFQRNMCICIQQDQWIHVLKEMFRVIKRGGCVELIEPELLHHQPGPVLQAFHAFYKEQCTQANIDLELKSMNDWLSEVGFEAIECKMLDLPIGEWQTETELKQYGFMNKEIQKTYLKNKKSEYTIKWGMSSIDYDVAVNEVCNEVEQYKSFTRFNCWMAKKPL